MSIIVNNTNIKISRIFKKKNYIRENAFDILLHSFYCIFFEFIIENKFIILLKL